MAAVSNACVPEVLELRHLTAEDLAPVLEEESLTWRTMLNWDFTASAELVRRFVRIQALTGYALLIDGRPVGYSYYVCEDRKALIGDLYLLREFSTTENEDRLLFAVLNSLLHNMHLKRVEAQLMMLHGPFERNLPFSKHVEIHPRNFMMVDLNDAAALPEGRAATLADLGPWSEKRQEDAAQLIAAAYQGHVDSRINDQYRSVSGAKRFLTNIVQYPGCGLFFGPGSFLAEADGRLLGISLTSLVASDVGHITQICVSPEAKRIGLGYEMLRRSLRAMADHGCEKASLTVTAVNQEAIQLYQRMGFRAMRRFAAFVWEGF
ncbi:MAG: GNAT family N-acetyltransferase [Bryobacteraceae bacterium]